VSSLSPGRIALGYGGVAILWIAFSDSAVTYFKLDPAVMTIKGAAFVVVTASLLYFTIRRLVQTVQRTSEERDEAAKYLAEAQQLSHTGSWALDVASGKYLYASEEFFRIFELDAQEGLPSREDFSRLIHPEDWDRANGSFEQQLREKTDITIEYRIVLPSGTVKHVHAIRHPVLNDAGEVVRLVGTVFDITERKQAEQEVRNTAAQWQATFDAVQDVVLLLDKDGRILRANQAAAEFLGRPCDNIVGGHCYGLIHGTSAPPAECPLAKMRQSRRHEEAEVLARKGGPWLSVSADPVFDPSGELTHVVHVARDITERKRAEDNLRQSAAYLAESQRLSHTGSWALDVASNEYVYCSEEFLRIFGSVRTWEEALQRIHPDDRERVQRNVDQVIRTRADAVDEYRIVLPDGTLRHIHVIRHPVLNAAGEVVQLVGTVLDITERKRAEEERQANLLFLESLDRINRAMQGSSDIEQMLSGVLDAVLSIFACDRAWLAYPCDPQAPTWRVAMEHNRPEFPGAFVRERDLPVDAEVARVFEAARSSGGAVRFGPGADQPLPAELAERFKIQSMIAMVVPPKLGQPYLLGLHQCSGPRVWAPTEERLFQEIGRRLTDALTSVLIFRTLRDSERRLEEAQRIAHVGYWDRDLDAGRITLSEEGARIFGLQPEERVVDLTVWHERWQTLIHPEDRPRAAAAATAALAGGPRYDVEYQVVHRTGEVRIVHSQGDVIRDASGRPIRMFGIMQDITERKRAETELRTSEERFRTLMQFSFDVYWESDAQHRFTRQEFAEGLSDAPAPGSEIGKRRWEISHLEPDETAWKKHRAAMDAHLPFRDFELARATSDGGKRYMSVSGLPVFDETGRFIGYRGVGRNITERKRAEEFLRQSEAYLAEAQRLSHTGSWAFDVANNKYVYLSEECARIFELAAQEDLRTREAVSRLIHPEDRPRVNDDYETTLRDKVDTASEFRIVLPSGTAKHVQAIRHPVLNEAGEVVKIVGTVIDITERKHAERERDRLRQLEAELAHINRVSVLGELTASIAHEVGQPLAGVVSNGGACLRWLARETPNLEEAREAAKRIVRDGKRAGEIIARIRALTRRATTPTEKLDLNQTIQEVLALVGDDAMRKRARIRPQCAADLAPVAGDRVQLQQVVLNLVMNGIEAMSSVADRPRDLVITTRNVEPDQVQVTVEDAGTGLDPTAMDKIFDPFYTTKPSGMGMGLSICRSILQAHGGRLWATAKDGPGTLFHFTLPRYPQEGPHA
jgi:PAS domain S-box-containing protein